jgi:hypothetical protein
LSTDDGGGILHSASPLASTASAGATLPTSSLSESRDWILDRDAVAAQLGCSPAFSGAFHGCCALSVMHYPVGLSMLCDNIVRCSVSVYLGVVAMKAVAGSGPESQSCWRSKPSVRVIIPRLRQ